jgi:tetratricopeptide (TPR) repeat protein
MFTYLTGDTGRAFELSELALATSPEAGLPPGDLGRALRLRSSIANAASRPDEALAALEDAIPLLEQAGDRVSAGRSLVTLADAHRRRGDFARAVEWAARGVALLR